LEKGDKLPNNDNIVYWYDDSISVDGFIEEGTKTQTHIYRRMRFAEEGLTENPKLSDWCLVEGIGGNEGILFTNFRSVRLTFSTLRTQSSQRIYNYDTEDT